MASRLSNYDIPVEKIFKLGPFECLSSTFINALILLNKNYKYLLLNYWFVDFYNELLVGFRRLNLCLIPYLYGIDLQLHKGKIRDIIELVDEGNLAIVQCMASQLNYFPARYLARENTELDHFFLLYDYNSTARTYKIIDSMADFSSGIPERQLEKLMDTEGNLSYVPLLNNNYKEPELKNIFIRTTVDNYNHFTQEDCDYGRNSFALFYNKVLNSMNLSETGRNGWLDQNYLTISSLANNRDIIWKCFKEFKLFNSGDEKIVEDQVNMIIKQWKSLAFSLLRFRKAMNEKITDEIKKKLDWLKEKEELVLYTMSEISRRTADEEIAAG